AVFDGFISPKMKAFKGDFLINAVFEEAEWEKNGENMPPFDRVYGRILYDVHKGQTEYSDDYKQNAFAAVTCTRKDCKSIFNDTLPELRKTIESMDKAMVQIKQIEGEIKELQEKLDKLLQETASLKQAEDCINAMEQSGAALVTAFSEQGIELVNQGGTHTLFWDRFSLENIAQFSADPVKVTMEATLPTYSETIENMATYHTRIHALNSEEEAALQSQKTLWKKTLELSKQVEKRDNQMIWQT
ncbi:MAG: hypothetical protein KDK71_06705, partial [Chlamydiia bacterium]|nr:hypothetical protein [Chlamydiia bacterium]